MTSYFLSLCLAASVGIDQGPDNAPPPKPVEPAPVAPAAPPVLNVLPMVECPKPICISDFCHSFVPVPGTYEVLFVHPVKGCPVWVCFTLPPNCGMPKICCTKRDIIFDYGCKAVDIKFKILCGKVAVLYN
jgi:hypothetical protein